MIDEESQLVVSGVYNPMILGRMGIWKTQGLEGLAKEVYGESLFVVDGNMAPEEKINEFIRSLTDNEKILWYGGGVYTMDFLEFQKAVKSLEIKLQKIYSDGISIKVILHAKRGQGK